MALQKWTAYYSLPSGQCWVNVCDGGKMCDITLAKCRLLGVFVLGRHCEIPWQTSWEALVTRVYVSPHLICQSATTLPPGIIHAIGLFYILNHTQPLQRQFLNKMSKLPKQNYSTDFTKWDRFFISGWPALTLASPSLARAQARRDRRRIGRAQRMKWARAPTRFGPGKYTRPKPTWACTHYNVWRLTWMLWTMCHLAGLARLALGISGQDRARSAWSHSASSEQFWVDLNVQ